VSKPYKLSVVAPDRTVYEDTVQSAIVPAEFGYMGVLADHAPTIVALKPGIVEYIDAANQTHFVSISGGFLEVSGGGAIVLASTAEKASDIDVSRAEKALEEARRALRGEVSGVTTQQATEELERAMVRIKAAKRN
jgi:F-type H+-transporting ATPase subunit epsilon